MKMIEKLTSLSKWTAAFALLIASMAAPVMARGTGTVKISGRFSMDYLYGELDLSLFEPDLLAVYYNGREHTWTLTLHGTSQSHHSNGSYYGTEIHSTSPTRRRMELFTEPSSRKDERCFVRAD